MATYQSTDSDPNLFVSYGFVPNFGVGFHYQSPLFYFAASIPHLLNTERFALDNERVALATELKKLESSKNRCFSDIGKVLDALLKQKQQQENQHNPRHVGFKQSDR